jgi:hypothetical protein
MELMIAVALIGIGILGAVSAFTGIHKSIQYSKARTLATNIAQEKMQIITQKPYYEVLVTTAPATYTNVTPNFNYDPFYFLPDTLTEGGVSFTRYTNVQIVQEVNGVIQIVPDPLTPDTGMRQITETVVWAADSGNKALTIQYVLNNPDTAMASTWLKGVVTDAATATAIPGALVDAAENIGWRDTTDNAGNYKINLVPGSFNFLASAQGYYTKSTPLSVPFNNSTTLNFALTAIASGTVSGTAYIDNHLVISQVVASTGPANGIEYIELYNPTTSPVNIGTTAGNNAPNIVPVLWDASNNGFIRHLIYVSTYVPPNGYYLISNTNPTANQTLLPCSTFTVTGVAIQPDACWLKVVAPNHTFECGSQASGCSANPITPDAGGISLGNANAYSSIGAPVNMANWPAAKIDSVAWSKGVTPAPSNAVEGTGYTLASGIQVGEDLYRYSAPGTYQPGKGSAYDTNTNSNDLIEISLAFGPHTSSTIQVPVAGTPAAGARVSITDGLSATSTATLTGNFTVPSVATGTWVVFIDSNSSSAEIDNVSLLVANSIVSIPNGSTSPQWPAAGFNNAVLSTNGVVGIISGKVTDVTNNAIPGGITVTAGGANTVSGPNGSYAIRVTPGIYNVIANPGNANSSYQMQSSTPLTVSLGDATQNINFALSNGGQISGFISRDGVNPLPGVAVVALDAFGTAHDTEASGNNGKFTLINLTTGTYTVQPILDTKELSTPPSVLNVNVNPGFTTQVGTFTITGAMGQVQGTVTAGGSPIKSGVLVVVSTQGISTPPPALSSSTLTSAAYYADSSNESGSYSVDVRGSTTSVYNVTAFYMHLNNQTPVISSGTCTNVTVTAGFPTTQGTKACLAFSW